MLDTSIADRVRQVVAELHSRAEMISVYRVAAQMPVVNGGHDMKALTEFIAEEAIRLKASVCWDDGGNIHRSAEEDHFGSGEKTIQ